MTTIVAVRAPLSIDFNMNVANIPARERATSRSSRSSTASAEAVTVGSRSRSGASPRGWTSRNRALTAMTTLGSEGMPSRTASSAVSGSAASP